MRKYSRKEFVCEGSVEKEKDYQDAVCDQRVSGEDISQLYRDFVDVKEDVQECGAIVSKSDTYFCCICEEVVAKDQEIDHTLSVSHQFNRNRKEGIQPKKQYHIPTGNPGYQILLKNGWNEKGFGRCEEGTLDPIKTSIKNDRLGIGIPPVCPLKVTHTAMKTPRRPNLHHRTIPSGIEKMNVFDALHALRTTDEQKYAVTKRHREILLKRDRMKHQLLFRELYRS